MEHVERAENGRCPRVDGLPRLGPGGLERPALTLPEMGAEQTSQVTMLAESCVAPVHLAWRVRVVHAKAGKVPALTQDPDELVRPVAAGAPMDQVADTVNGAQPGLRAVGNPQQLSHGQASSWRVSGYNLMGLRSQPLH